jgi:hypothetical protein
MSMQKRRVFRRGDALSGEKCQNGLSLGVVPLALVPSLLLVLVLIPGQGWTLCVVH